MSECVTKTEIAPSVKRRVAASVFIVAFAFGLNITGILPVLGILNEKYQQYGTSAVQLLQTIMYLLLIVGSLMVGWMTTKISKKNITLLGLLIVGCCGVLPFFLESFAVLLIARIVIGFGYGIMGPMNTAIISEFFPPEERAGYMGLHVVGMGIGTMVGNLLGGMLAGIGYRYFYLVYLIAFAALLGVKAVLIETPPAQVEKASDLKLNKMVFVISFASFVHTLFINAYNTNISIYITQNITEDPSVTGVVTAVNAAFALLVGMFFAKISGFFKTYTLTFSIFAAAVGYGVILFVPGMAGIYIASALCGVSLSCFMAIGSYLISISVEQEAVAKASGMFSIIGGIGGLIAPIFLGNAAKLLGENSARNQFVISFAGMLIFGVIVWIASANKAKKEKNQ
ncbi:MFS transporter [Mediterraneibacter glycyrrhizinilyticus]|uniref:MFS transporter n=1 Tax=Mediterraneibacter glycyrrhizinilyticus TaxID=342942 RepID=UPI0018A0FF11|nr:MFS transporter [Mediterraneibacter glycyrrhizinilyticus]